MTSLCLLTGLILTSGIIGAENRAVADSLPTYTGVMSFPAIAGPADPEDYLWEVELGEGQILEAIDGTHVGVYHAEGHLAFAIVAPEAHDADGTDVPTSLGVSNGNVLTLTVHHRAGNSDGAPFVYLIVEGKGWLKIGGGTIVVAGPPDQQELREAQEAIERANRAAQPEGLPVARRCRVPVLKGRSLRAAKSRLRKANCTIGHVRKRRGASAVTGRVVRQRPGAGASVPSDAAVTVTLGP